MSLQFSKSKCSALSIREMRFSITAVIFHLFLLSSTSALAQPNRGLAFTGSEHGRDARSGRSFSDPGALCTNPLNYVQSILNMNGTASQDFNTANDIYDVEAADDFTLPVASALSSISVNGMGMAPDSFLVKIYSNGGGSPGTLLYSQLFVDPAFTISPTFDLSACPVLQAGTYWISVQAVASFSLYGQWYWTTAADGSGTNWNIRNPNGGFGACLDWSDGAVCGFASGTGPGLAYDIATCVANVLSAIGPNCRNVNASLDANGNTYFSLSDIVTNFPAAAPARITIKDPTGYAVYGPATVFTGNIVFNACHLRDETLTINVETEGGACWSNLTFKQVNGPIIENRNYTVFCFDELVHDPYLYSRPIAYIPCQAPLQASYVTDWFIPYDCVPGIQDTVKVILREWEAYDKLGRRGVAFDTIVVLQLGEIDSNHIFCADKDTLYCSDTTERIGPFITYEDTDQTCDTIWLVHTSDLDNDGMLEFHPTVLDAKCGLDVYLDYYKVQGECGNIYRVKVEMKQSCYGPADDTCFVTPPAGTPPNQAVQLAPGYWRCEFWLHDLDTIPPDMYCKKVELFYGTFGIKNWNVAANPNGEMVTGPFFDPEKTIELNALPYRLRINSYENPFPLTTRLEENAIPAPNTYNQDLTMNFIAPDDLSFDFGWMFDIESSMPPINSLNNLNGFYTEIEYYISINGTEYPVIEEGDMEFPVRTQRNMAPVLLTQSRDGVLSIPLLKGDSFAIRASWSSPFPATLSLYGPNIVSTSEHECAAHSYIPPLFVSDDWSGVKQVKAIVESAGTFIMTYDPQDSCWVSHEQVKLPKNGEYYTVLYEAYDSCHNMAVDSCLIYVKDRVKPVAVMDKSVTVSLSDKKVWLDASAFDEGSWDNCEVNFILIRRSDWQESCIDLCDSISACYVDDHHDTLWVANLETDKSKDAVEAHYAQTLRWLCEDDTPCGELIYNAWLYDLMKYATLHCNPHLYGVNEEYFKEKFAEAYYADADFRAKFDYCQPTDPNQTTAQRFSPFHPEPGNLVDFYEQLGGGWSDAIAFDCADACQYVTVEMLVMDYWCNWTKVWNKVKVEDKNPPTVVYNVKDQETISCKSYHDAKYFYPGELHPVNIEWLVERATQQDQKAFNLLDQIFGGYQKAWRTPYGTYVDSYGDAITHDILFIDSVCVCTDKLEQVYIYDEHLGYYWKDSVVTDCYYVPDTTYFQQGVVQVNCQENVHCKQEIWYEFDHCGQGYLYRKFKIWQSCPDSFYSSDLYTDSVFHPVDTLERIQRIFVGKECALNKYMFDVPGDLTIEACGIEYNDDGNVIGDAGPENTGYARYKLEDDCRIVGIAHKDKVYKIVGGEEACYKIYRTWYFADWCGTGSAPINKNWWNDYSLVLDSCLQKILVIDKTPPVCEIKGPVLSGGTIEMGGCSYTLNVEVNATDICGLTSYEWEIKNTTNAGQIFLEDQGQDYLTGGEEETFEISSAGLLPGTYKLSVHLEDECNNENYCEYYFTIVPVKKPTPVCYSSLTARLTPWDRDQDGLVDTAHVIIWASEFDRSSTPSCGDDSVEFRVEILDGIEDETAAGDLDYLELGCDHVGTQLVRLWVVSLPSGTRDYCDIVLVVQAGESGCGSVSATNADLEIRESVLQFDQTGVRSGTNQAIPDPVLRQTNSDIHYETNTTELLQNRPNPFRSETTLGFILAEKMQANLTVYDMNGKVLKNFSGVFAKGYNEINLLREQLNSSSILFYRLQTENGFSEVKRMILIE